jgi:hypothetical protein
MTGRRSWTMGRKQHQEWVIGAWRVAGMSRCRPAASAAAISGRGSGEASPWSRVPPHRMPSRARATIRANASRRAQTL